MTTFELGISSATAVTVYPEYDYYGGKKQIRSEHRTRSGRMYRYIWGDYVRFKFSLELINNSDMALINSWWESGSELLLFITSSTATEVNSVVIQNVETPLGEFNKPYEDYHRGSILLEGY